jgi:hypothetical protein
MVITAWSELYPGDLPLLEKSSSIVDHSARHSQLAGADSYFTEAPLTTISVHLSNKQEKNTQPNPTTHGVSTTKKSLHLGLGTVYLVSLNMAVHLLYFHSLQPPIPWNTFNTACQSLSQPPLPNRSPGGPADRRLLLRGVV